MAQSEVITFKVTPEVKALLEERAAELGWSKSQLARHLIFRALEVDPELSLTTELAYSISASIQSRMPRVWERVAQVVQEELHAPLEQAAQEAMPETLPQPVEHEPVEGLGGRRKRTRRGRRGGR